MRINDPPTAVLSWFGVEIDLGDKPELHLVDLKSGELLRCFELIKTHNPEWSHRTFFIESEGRDFTVQERPDVAVLVAGGEIPYACIGASALQIGGEVLPLVEMFLYVESIQFFWSPGDDWTPATAYAFLSLLAELLDATAESRLIVDYRYPEPYRQQLRDGLLDTGFPQTRLAH